MRARVFELLGGDSGKNQPTQAEILNTLTEIFSKVIKEVAEALRTPKNGENLGNAAMITRVGT